MTQPTAESLYQSLARRLGRVRLLTAATMMVERGWPLILPLLVVASLFVSLSWLGVFRLLPDMARIGLAGLFALAGLAALYPLRFYRQPSASEIDRRIESANAMLHTPVQVQTDRPSGKSGIFADALWREHQRRMAEKLDRVGSDLPHARVPERDPWGLRAAAALLLVVAFAFSHSPLGGRLDDAFHMGMAFETIPPRIDAWVTPPSYTGKAPILLTADRNQQAASFTVPQGSEVSLRVAGGTGNETLSFTDANGLVREIAPKSSAETARPVATGPQFSTRQFAEKLDQDGVLSLQSGGGELQNWAFAIIPDKPPTIRFTDDPKRAVNGALELHYEIVDDYGAASAQAEFALAEEPASGTHPLYKAPEMPLTVPRRGKENGAVKVSSDLTEHAWAGSTVKLTLKATDDAGQEGVSETRTFTLPERPFSNPLARAVVEHRRILALDARQKPHVLELIDAITLRPEDTIKNMAHFLGLMAGRSKLDMATNDDQLRSVADYFWEMALAIEDGSLSAAEKRLRQAQESLKQALENGASDEEIDKLMKELREAMAEFLREYAERAAKDPNLADQMPQNGQELRQSDLERMMDQIENLAKSGNRDQAQELLSQLQDMMNNLQARRQQQPGQNGDQSEMRQQMDKLGEIMRRQQEMMNETFRMDQMQRGDQQRGEEFGEQGQGQQPGQGQQGSPMTPEEFAEALKRLQEGQGQLRNDLEGLTKGLEGLGIQPGEGFGEAGEAMGEAEGALGQGEGERAVGEQGRALEALRKGAQDMMRQMQQAMQGDEGGSEQGRRQQNTDRDPLGRPRA
ncbi:MAG: TIGR02302 family protein, partial [Pseudaminobacter sp.]